MEVVTEAHKPSDSLSSSFRAKIAPDINDIRQNLPGCSLSIHARMGSIEANQKTTIDHSETIRMSKNFYDIVEQIT